VPLHFDDAELTAKAVQLGVIQDGEALPRHLRSRVAAALLEDRKPRAEQPTEPVLAQEIVVQPGGTVTIDGRPFPWLIAKQAMEIGLNPDGVSTVRLTLLTRSLQVLKPKPATDNESE
jgi:hypothetical protein